MSLRDSNFDAYVMKIYSVLDRLDYYRLLGVSPAATSAEVKQSFYAIAKKFHPDRNRDAPKQVFQAIYTIYKRINEANRVLQNPNKRERYDDALKMGMVRLEQDMRKSFEPTDPADTISQKSAREFYLKAKEELEKGNLLQADLHIKMAANREPNNQAIRTLVADILNAKLEKKKKKG
jgi:curved DNA-binding protein CbpA